MLQLTVDAEHSTAQHTLGCLIGQVVTAGGVRLKCTVLQLNF